jgi:hypothetical protein
MKKADTEEEKKKRMEAFATRVGNNSHSTPLEALEAALLAYPQAIRLIYALTFGRVPRGEGRLSMLSAIMIRARDAIKKEML